MILKELICFLQVLDVALIFIFPASPSHSSLDWANHLHLSAGWYHCHPCHLALADQKVGGGVLHAAVAAETG
jgi:hypothetical protein